MEGLRFFYPLAGIEKIRHVEEAEADVKSAELMAKIFDEIRRHNDVKDKTQMHNLNIFMSRLLFCYFAKIQICFLNRNCLPTPSGSTRPRTGTILQNLLTGHSLPCQLITLLCVKPCLCSSPSFLTSTADCSKNACLYPCSAAVPAC